MAIEQFGLATETAREYVLKVLRTRLGRGDVRDIAGSYGERVGYGMNFYEGHIGSAGGLDDAVAKLVTHARNHPAELYEAILMWRPDMARWFGGAVQHPTPVRLPEPQPTYTAPQRAYTQVVTTTHAPVTTKTKAVFTLDTRRPFLLLLRSNLNRQKFNEIAEWYGPRCRNPRVNMVNALGGDSLDGQIRELIDDAQRTSSAHILIDAVREVMPGLADNLPEPQWV